jgi:hypothetical protein
MGAGVSACRTDSSTQKELNNRENHAHDSGEHCNYSANSLNNRRNRPTRRHLTRAVTRNEPIGATFANHVDSIAKYILKFRAGLDDSVNDLYMQPSAGV